MIFIKLEKSSNQFITTNKFKTDYPSLNLKLWLMYFFTIIFLIMQIKFSLYKRLNVILNKHININKPNHAVQIQTELTRRIFVLCLKHLTHNT